MYDVPFSALPLQTAEVPVTDDPTDCQAHRNR